MYFDQDGSYGCYDDSYSGLPPYQIGFGEDVFGSGEFEEVTIEDQSLHSPYPYRFVSNPLRATPFDSDSVPISNGNDKPYDLGVDSEGDPPMSRYEPYEAAKHVAYGQRPMFKAKANIPELRELIEQCWASHMDQRPYFLKILKILEKIKENLPQDNHWNFFSS